jgi:hypothetical protein
MTALRVLQLARLACDSGAAEGEARNAALAACRIIIAKPDVLALVQPQPAYRPPAPERPEWRVIRSKFDGFCSRCATWFGAGERVAWAKGHGAMCVTCHRRRAA